MRTSLGIGLVERSAILALEKQAHATIRDLRRHAYRLCALYPRTQMNQIYWGLGELPLLEQIDVLDRLIRKEKHLTRRYEGLFGIIPMLNLRGAALYCRVQRRIAWNRANR